jgi:hypothetical protein
MEQARSGLPLRIFLFLPSIEFLSSSFEVLLPRLRFTQ